MFDLGRNTTTLSKFIGCIDLIDVHQISPKHPRNNDKGKCQEILIFEIFVPWSPFM